jgi:hypothetical protein
VVSSQCSVVSENMRSTIVIFVLLSTLPAQVVVDPSVTPCKKESLRPNLEVKVRKHILGQVNDATGAAFQGSKVLLRKLGKQGEFVEYRSAVTDTNGRFDLKSVEPGTYRFLPAPNRGWRQPREVACNESRECDIKLVLELNSTDQPFAQCPIR